MAPREQDSFGFGDFMLVRWTGTLPLATTYLYLYTCPNSGLVSACTNTGTYWTVERARYAAAQEMSVQLNAQSYMPSDSNHFRYH